jgi:hypothetical protein
MAVGVAIITVGMAVGGAVAGASVSGSRTGDSTGELAGHSGILGGTGPIGTDHGRVMATTHITVTIGLTIRHRTGPIRLMTPTAIIRDRQTRASGINLVSMVA